MLPNNTNSNIDTSPADNETNVRGILLALRYLTREAEGAGLIELARTLAEAELKCDRRTDNRSRLS